MTPNEQLLDANIRHAIYLQRFGGSVVNRIIALLNRADADIVEQLERRLGRIVERGFDGGPATTARLKALLEEVRALNAEAYAIAGKELTDQLREFAAYEVEWHARTLDSVLPASISVTAPPVRSVAAAALSRPFQGRLLKEWTTGLEAAKAARIRDAIRLGVVEGQTVQQITSRIRGTRAAGYSDGLMEIDRRGAEAMVRTAVNHVGTTAREAVFSDNADILSGVRWVSTLDARTTPVCQARDGKVYPVDSGPRPPAHIRCRSATAPVLADKFLEAFQGTQSRASQEGPVAGSLTYQQWLTRQSAAFQDEVLGPSRGKLFRAGGVALDRFVNRSGDELTLAQLRAKDPGAFEKAGLAA